MAKLEYEEPVDGKFEDVTSGVLSRIELDRVHALLLMAWLDMLYVANDDVRIYPQIAPEHKVREPPRVNNHREELSCQSTLLWCQY